MLKTALHCFWICLLSLNVQSLSGQISYAGTPLTFSHPEAFIGAQIPTYSLTVPNVNALLAQDEDRDRNGFNLRDGVAIIVDKGLDFGEWTPMQNGSRTWRMGLKAQGAYSLEVNFSDLFIPEGGTMYVFNPEGNSVHGAYSSINNKSSGRISVEMVTGEEVVIEYTEPSSAVGMGRVFVQDVAYRYRDVMSQVQSCQVDVACDEAEGWYNQVKSVVRIRSRINGQFFWSTGALMNNTAQDCRPFILTNMHSSIDLGTQSTDSDFEFYRFYFNFERESCGQGQVIDFKTIASCTKRGDSNDNGGEFGSDYMLVELSNHIPLSYNAYYAGWNVGEQVNTDGGITVHHPSGGAKKVSVYQEGIMSSNWGVSDTHWSIRWVETASGHGVTEGGSAGSPLFNAQGLVIGTLTGGSAYCNELLPGGQNQPDYFGKMSWHWNFNPNPPSEKLKEWLDPIHAGVVMFNGSSDPCNVLGVEELNPIDISVFPNPSDGQVFISHSRNFSNLDIKVYDVTGKEIAAGLYNIGEAGKKISIDLSNLENGLYFISTTDNGGQHFTHRVILSH